MTSATIAMAALTLLVAGCSGSDKAASMPDGGETSSADASQSAGAAKPTDSPKLLPPAPEVGECHKLTFSDVGLFSNQAKEVSCGGTHTASTFMVETLPERIAFEGVDIQNAAVQTSAAETCKAAFPAFIGGDAPMRALARLTATYFLPKQRDFDLGARWVRCDVIALQSQQALGPLPSKVKGLLDDQDALDEVGLCSTAEPGVEVSTLVMCTQPHEFRALAAVRLGDNDAAYPGVVRAEDTGQQCEELVSEELGVEGGFTYGWTFPSAADWTAGQRIGYCWNKTTD
ncbi:MAG: septum formation family protein [Nocardioidaceae bacterium]|nr:septum formation family protein [Nocardioidaceae bacterium]